ncbi:MarR family winged helix-turn-helix transcriptional regulator [Kineococcus aurantiacus]|uniref:DNA-binding MarR family transcriptional regulator n=1 Tax=Kineococcus aurantiacus TaxID=37633 RepID=A0A7Y9ARI1_9ACTN|nr:MarR family winged helix-turn-helix transcriptional regulator [Kineococcus aurantiacus]NYD20672.1 DNA-binding MarR family transcriptional regulator [Kineococcus aurantiacus]
MPENRTRAAVRAWESVFRLQATLLRAFAAQDVWSGLSVREYDVLYTLARCGGRSRLGELSEEVYLPQPSLSRLVDRLAAQGLLTREPDPRDGRGVVVVLTDPGAARQREIGGRHAAGIARAFEALTPAELAELTRLCAKALRG